MTVVKSKKSTTSSTSKKKNSIIEKWNGLSTTVQNISKTITACVTIVGFVSAALAWGVTCINSNVTKEVNALSDKTEQYHNESQMTASQNSLLILMNHDPYNVSAIQQEAYNYFCILNGDHYMHSVYSAWATQYGGDTAATLCEN